VNEKEIVGDSIAIEENLVISEGTVSAVAEAERAGLLVEVGAVEDKAIDDITFCHVGQGLIDPEHIFAERAAVAAVFDPVLVDDKFIVGGEKTEFCVAALINIKKIAFVCVNTSGNCVVLNSVVQ